MKVVLLAVLLSIHWTASLEASQIFPSSAELGGLAQATQAAEQLALQVNEKFANNLFNPMLAFESFWPEARSYYFSNVRPPLISNLYYYRNSLSVSVNPLMETSLQSLGLLEDSLNLNSEIKNMTELAQHCRVVMEMRTYMDQNCAILPWDQLSAEVGRIQANDNSEFFLENQPLFQYELGRCAVSQGRHGEALDALNEASRTLPSLVALGGQELRYFADAVESLRQESLRGLEELKEIEARFDFLSSPSKVAVPQMTVTTTTTTTTVTTTTTATTTTMMNSWSGTIPAQIQPIIMADEPPPSYSSVVGSKPVESASVATFSELNKENLRKKIDDFVENVKTPRSRDRSLKPLKEAISEAEKVKGLEISIAEGYEAMGGMYIKLQRWKEAWVSFSKLNTLADQLVERQPYFKSRALSGLGKCYRGKKGYDFYKAALAAAPADEPADSLWRQQVNKVIDKMDRAFAAKQAGSRKSQSYR